MNLDYATKTTFGVFLLGGTSPYMYIETTW